MDQTKFALIRLLGVPRNDVVDIVNRAADGKSLPIVWEKAGEVFVKCPDVSIVPIIEVAFGQAIISVDGSSLEDVVGSALAVRGWMLATAESCTGGMVGERITAIPGSSAWYLGGVVSYANRVKIDLLGVDPGLIESRGAVSREVVEAMALGAMRALGADVSLAVSGIAGPSGGTEVKPVGTVWFAWAGYSGVVSALRRFDGNRAMVREQAVSVALDGVRLLCRRFGDSA